MIEMLLKKAIDGMVRPYLFIYKFVSMTIMIQDYEKCQGFQ